MSAYGRHGVLAGETVILRAVFTDANNLLVSTDSIPDIYIYDPSVDATTIQSEIDAATFTSAFAGPLTPTLITTGFYELSFAVPDGSDDGTWHDVWVGDINTVDSSSYLSFRVHEGADLSAQTLSNNELILIELDETISNVAGDKTLAEDTVLAFSTEYVPLYASPDLLRLEIGTFADYIPDDTLALMIHWSSKEADFIAKPARCNRKDFEFARTKFVIFDAVLKAILLPGGSSASGSGGSLSAAGSKKQLGDLIIDRKGGSSGVSTLSSGVDTETLNYIRTKRDEWWRVTNAGGCIVPGQGFEPEYAVRGAYDPDRRNAGRLWYNPEYVGYPQPSVNAKIRLYGRRRGRFGFTDFRRGLS